MQPACRWRNPVVHVLLFAFVLAVVACGVAEPADAGTIKYWTSVQPRGVVGTNTPLTIQGSGAADSFPLQLTTAKLSVDGTIVPRSAYTVASPNGRTVYFHYIPEPRWSDGLHTFRVEISDSAGKVSAYQWTAIIAQAPSVKWESPAAMVTNGRPFIEMSISDNTPGTRFDIAGAVRTGSSTGPVVATFSATGNPEGCSGFMLDEELAPGTYYVTATVTDSASNVAVLSGSSARRFECVAPAAMSLQPADCLSAGCHIDQLHPATTRSCAGCHVVAYHEYTDCGDCHEGHSGPVAMTGRIGSCEGCHNPKQPSVPRHTAESVAPSHQGSCEGCHNESLLDVHAVAPEGSGYSLQCDVCHASGSPEVQAAIIAGDTSCSACHDRIQSHGDLDGIHQATISSGYVQALTDHMSGPRGEERECSECHATMNLLKVHGPTWDNCALCHEAGGPRSTFDTWEQGCQQGACHPTLHDLANADANHQAVARWGSGQCLACHVGPPVNYSAPLECTVMCHTSKVPAVGDSDAPVTIVENAAAYFPSPAQVELRASDAGSSVSGIFYRIDGGAWEYAPGSACTVSVSAGGGGLLEYYAVDWFGTAEELQSYTVVIDETAPVTVTEGEGHPVEYPRHLTATDVGSGVATTYYSIDGGPYLVYGYFEHLLGLRTNGRPGAHSLAFYSVDAVGNVEMPTQVDFVIPDTGAPTSYLSGTLGTSAQITAEDYHAGAISGVQAIRYRLDGGDWVEATFPVGLAAAPTLEIEVPADGAYQLEYHAIDHFGNAESVRSTTLTIDRGAPVFTVNAEDEYVGDGYVSFTGTDAGSGIGTMDYYVNPTYAPWHVTGVSTTGQIRLPAPASGSRVFTVGGYATDKAGNVSAVVGPRTIIVHATPDLAAPTTSASHDDGVYDSDDGTFVLELDAIDTKSGVESTYYQVDGGEWQVSGSATTSVILLGSGEHTVAFYSVDRAGNAEPTQTRAIEIVGPPEVRFHMTNTLVDGATWDTAPYDYDIEVFSAGGATNWGDSGNTWLSEGDPVLYLTGDRTAPFTALVTVYMRDGDTQTFQWEDIVVERGESVDLYGTFADELSWLDIVPPTTTADVQESYVGTAVINLTAEDTGGSGLDSVYYTLDGGEMINAVTIVIEPPAEGVETHTITYFSNDDFGNWETPNTATFTVAAP